MVARRTAAEEKKTREGEGGSNRIKKQKEGGGGVRYGIKTQKEVGERITHDKKC